MNGWVKFYRSINDHELLENDNSCFVVLLKLLTRVDRETGTYTTGRFKLAEITNLKPTTAYSALRRLQNDNIVTLESDNKKTKITICNWSKYQGLDDNQNDNKMTTNRQQNDNKMTLNKNKEIKNKEKEVKTTSSEVGVFGKPEINEIVEKFQTEMELHLSRVPLQRRAAQTLLGRYGLSRTLAGIEAAAAARGRQYAPVIVSLEDLRDKWNNLEEFYRRETKPASFVDIDAIIANQKQEV